MPWGTILVSVALFSGVYLGTPHIITGTTSNDIWVKNAIPMIAGVILVIILVQSFFGKK